MLALASIALAAAATYADEAQVGSVAATHSINVGSAMLYVATPLAAVDRGVLVPVRIWATSAPTKDPRERPGAGDVVVGACADWRCTVREEVRVPIDGDPVSLSVPMWPQGLQLRASYEGYETSCCSTSGSGRTWHVVASTLQEGSFEITAEREGGGGVRLLHVGNLFAREPALLDAVAAVIIDKDEGWPADDDDRAALRAWVARGGVAVMRATRAAPLLAGIDPDAPRSALGGGVPFRFSGVLVDREAPSSSARIHFGAGAFVVLPDAANRTDIDECLTTLFRAYPAILEWAAPTTPEELPAMRAAAAALTPRGPGGLAFAIALVVVVAVGVGVRGARRKGWLHALKVTAATSTAASAALALLSWAPSVPMLAIFGMPGERHARVVTWTGPGAAWETGVDAVRPHRLDDVTATTPVAPSAVIVLGDDTLAPRALSLRATPMEHHERTAPVSSSSALAALWQRPAPRAHAVELVGDGAELVNHLDVPLRAVLLENGNRVGKHIAPNARVARDSFAMRNTWDRVDVAGISVAEERLLNELMNACSRRRSQVLTPPSSSGGHACGAAVTVLDDGTLLGIEVTR